jgi:hypothetical protein
MINPKQPQNFFNKFTPIRFFYRKPSTKPKISQYPFGFSKKNPPKQTKNENQSLTCSKTSSSLFGYQENAGFSNSLASPASGRDPPASGAVLRPSGG